MLLTLLSELRHKNGEGYVWRGGGEGLPRLKRNEDENPGLLRN